MPVMPSAAHLPRRGMRQPASSLGDAQHGAGEVGRKGAGEPQGEGGCPSRVLARSVLPLTLSFVLLFLSPLRRARSSARWRQRGNPGSRRPLPLGHPPRSPPPRLLIRERRVPGGSAAPLPRRGLAPPRRPGTPLRQTGDAPEDGRRRRVSEDGPVSRVPGSFSPPVTLYRPHHVPPDRHPPPSPRGCGPARTGLPAAPSSPRRAPPGTVARDVRLVVSLSRLCPRRPRRRRPLALPSALLVLNVHSRHQSSSLSAPNIAGPPLPGPSRSARLAVPFQGGHPTQPLILRGSCTCRYSFSQLMSYPASPKTPHLPDDVRPLSQEGELGSPRGDESPLLPTDPCRSH